MNRYAIGVGANRGDRRATIARAYALLAAEMPVLAASTLHETAPVGGPAGQDPFLNAVWVVATDLGPHQVLHALQRIETACGRVRTIHWGPRTLDLDLLLRADGLRISTPVLTLPHPLWRQREFVRRPLAEVWPVLFGPGTSSAGD
jgi:2-amino-4-hydroxy-6-hydroxymethyldihydropteridine diphosphokinase